MAIKLRPNHFWNSISINQIEKSSGLKYTVRGNRQRFFFPDEWMAFYDSLDKREDNKYSNQEITFNSLLNTGARIMELQNVQVQDIDLERGNIVLRVTKKIVHRPGVDKQGKRNIRVVAISDKFAKFLKAVVKERDLKPEEYLPILTTQGANQAMKIALKKATIPDWQMFSLHNIRKTAEMWLLSLGIDSFKVVKRFGHSREIALKHYLSSDIFMFEEKQMIKDIMGDIYGLK